MVVIITTVTDYGDLVFLINLFVIELSLVKCAKRVTA